MPRQARALLFGWVDGWMERARVGGFRSIRINTYIDRHRQCPLSSPPSPRHGPLNDPNHQRPPRLALSLSRQHRLRLGPRRLEHAQGGVGPPWWVLSSIL